MILIGTLIFSPQKVGKTSSSVSKFAKCLINILLRVQGRDKALSHITSQHGFYPYFLAITKQLFLKYISNIDVL